MPNCQFWLGMMRAVLLPAALTLLVLVAPTVLLSKGWMLVYLKGIAIVLIAVVWRTVVRNALPRLLMWFGF